MMLMTNEYTTSHRSCYLQYNRLSVQNSETALFKALKPYSIHLNFKEGFEMF
jgi:hypothetical protein